jgi:hypothetical protein
MKPTDTSGWHGIYLKRFPPQHHASLFFLLGYRRITSRLCLGQVWFSHHPSRNPLKMITHWETLSVKQKT